MTVEVAPVVMAKLVATRATAGFSDSVFTDVMNPVQAFADTSIQIEERYLGPDKMPLAGTARITFDPGTTAAAFDDDCQCYRTGTVEGVARFSNALASLELDLVGDDALADFEADISEPIIVTLGTVGTTTVNSAVLFLQAIDAAGRPIIGRGPKPVVTTADPSIAGANLEDLDADFARSITILASKLGTTTLDVTWGGVHKTFVVQVIPPKTI